MSNRFDPPINGPSNPIEDPDTTDATSETTTPGGGNSNARITQYQKKTLHFKFEVSPINDPNHVTPTAIHINWIRTILDEHHGDDICFLHNISNARILNFDLVKWSKPKIYEKYFKISRQSVPDRKHQMFPKKTIQHIVHPFHTKIVISNLKHSHRAFSSILVKDNKGFPYKH